MIFLEEVRISGWGAKEISELKVRTPSGERFRSQSLTSWCSATPEEKEDVFDYPLTLLQKLMRVFWIGRGIDRFRTSDNGFGHKRYTA